MNLFDIHNLLPNVLMWEVKQIMIGYVESNIRNQHEAVASGSVTLITGAQKRILVDCGNPWNGDEIVRALEHCSLKSDDITDLVITHGHSDHCGNLSLFTNAIVYMDHDRGRPGAIYSRFEDNFQITESVRIMQTPGHTDHDLSVAVFNSNGTTTVVAGDIFENGDSDDWEPNSRYPDQQELSRQRIREMAHWIVPGHGSIFRNTFLCH